MDRYHHPRWVFEAILWVLLGLAAGTAANVRTIRVQVDAICEAVGCDTGTQTEGGSDV